MILPVLLASLLPLAAAQTARVESFYPQGTVKNVRQVQVRFSLDMTPLGDPRSVATPFEIDCGGEPATARWADSRDWIYDFKSDLDAGVRCTFRLKPDLKALDGTPVGGQQVFEFTTGGPAILQSTPWEGSRDISEDQIFVLRLDAAPDPSTLPDNVYFAVEGILDQVGFRIVEGERRRQILKSFYQYRDEDPGETVLLLQAKQTFPHSAQVRLVWGRGVATRSGVATEQTQTLPFRTRPAFTAVFECRRENAESPCIPLTDMRVEFSAPVPATQAQQAVLSSGDRAWKPKKEEDELVSRLVFEGPFPEAAEFSLLLPAGLRDDSGRPLANQNRFPLTVRTAEFPPLAKFAADFGILEAKTEPVLPVTLRNLEPELEVNVLEVRPTALLTGQIRQVLPERVDRMLFWMRKIRSRSYKDRGVSVFAEGDPGETPPRRFSLPKPNGEKAFEVVGIPLGGPGFYVAEIRSEVLGTSLLPEKTAMYVPTVVLATNLGVHFKWGLESSLAWVTELDSGEPVKDALVQVWDCRANALAETRTDSRGVARLPQIPARGQAEACSYRPYDDGLLVTARRNDDFSFVHSSWNDGIEPWRFQLPYEYDERLASAQTVFDRLLFRAGETVHMKHVLRRHVTSGFEQISAQRPRELVISHQGSDQSFKLPLEWDEAGLAVNQWTIPKEARLGVYTVEFRGDAGSWSSGSFRVEEYRVPLMRGAIRPPAQAITAPSEVRLDLSASYLSGGPAARLPVVFRSAVEPFFPPAPEGLEGFSFANGGVREEVVRDEQWSRPERTPLKRRELTLDQAGGAQVTVDELPQADRPLQIRAEMEFKDPNGEIQTVSSRIPLWNAQWLAGVKPDSWAASRDALKFKVAVVDLQGRPVRGAPVQVEVFQTRTYSHRKRLVGGFYAYEHVRETTRKGQVCGGRTNRQGLLICDSPTSLSGRLTLLASTTDPAGNRSLAHRDVWVSGEDDWWFAAADDDRIDLIPEETRYEPGDTAVFQVRMPFRRATALITVEREGVAEAFVENLSGKEPLIKVPIKGAHAPNVFVSALVVRGRVGDVQPTAMLDLGKPAYKLGVAQINVGWRAHELKVSVAADREVYRVREKARIRIEVRRADGSLPPAGTEVAVAAVDEGLLELAPNTSWRLLENMMGRRGYGVETSTAQMHVVGKRHFGLKALPQGGGGGQQSTRELFDTLLLWEARLKLDEKGRAQLDVPLNDSLTAFRIAAVATGGDDLFGSGETTIRSTQDLSIFAGVPPLVREGDRFRAGFTVRNATERDMQVEIGAQVRQLPPSSASGPESLEVLRLELAPGEAREVGWETTVPPGAEAMLFEIEARDSLGFADRVSVRQRVVPAVPVRVFQATLAQLDPEFQAPVQRPPDAIPDRGGIRLNLRPSLLASLDSVREFMNRYPYTCLEQRASKAVALNDPAAWKALMSALPSFLDGDGLAKYFPSSWRGSDALTAYLLAIAHERGWEVPEESRAQMLDGLTGFAEGRVVRYSSLPTADLAIRKLSAVEALSRYGQAQAKLLSSITIRPNLWPTSAVIDWWMILHRLSDLPDREKRLTEAERILRSRLNFQGSVMSFSSEDSDRLWWLMVSADANANRLVLGLLETGSWREDTPRALVGSLSRRRNGRWDLTTANAWGVLATEKFAAAFESTPVAGVTRSELADSERMLAWEAWPEGGELDFPWPASRARLRVRHQGPGKPWLSVQSRAAIPLKEPFSSGFAIEKTMQPIEQKEPGVWSAGDIVRVRLSIDAQTDMTWVVVDDPVPAGSTVLGAGLGRDSALATQGEERDGVWPTFEERSFEAFRAYYDYVPKGAWTVEYTLRLNNPGVFQMPSTRVEALYHPELLGERPNPEMRVEQ